MILYLTLFQIHFYYKIVHNKPLQKIFYIFVQLFDEIPYIACFKYIKIGNTLESSKNKGKM